MVMIAASTEALAANGELPCLRAVSSVKLML
jgi:hypothetical protein